LIRAHGKRDPLSAPCDVTRLLDDDALDFMETEVSNAALSW
jgi:hypothetical protein